MKNIGECRAGYRETQDPPTQIRLRVNKARPLDRSIGTIPILETPKGAREIKVAFSLVGASEERLARQAGRRLEHRVGESRA